MGGVSGSDSRSRNNFLHEIIDTLASEYSWTKKHILEEVYPEEIELLFLAIGERKGREEKTRLRSLVQASLIPHIKDTDRKAFLRSLEDSPQIAHNLSKEEQKEENKRAKDFFSTL